MNEQQVRDICRRTFLRAGAGGLGLAALHTLLPDHVSATQGAMQVQGNGGVVHPLHHAPKCKRVIFLYQAGGPSHLETFDEKPKLRELSGTPMPDSFTKEQQVAQLQGNPLVCFGGQHAFKTFGASGQRICELFPHIGSVADELCIVRSMWTEQINHDPAHTFMNTGSIITGRPSMGSWIMYGLGSEASNLPGFIVLLSSRGGQMQPIASRQWSAGFLPGNFQGVKLNSVGDAVLHIQNPAGINAELQRDTIAAVNRLNRARHAEKQDPEILARIAQYEMAFKMQSSVPELLNMQNEPQKTLERYGARPGDGSFASNCLLARKLVERGVRFVQIYNRDWDFHTNIAGQMVSKAEEVDRPTAALIADLKERGLLDETLVIWGGEFGRTPMSQGDAKGDTKHLGRDHHIKGFSFLLAGGGIRGGASYGATDELGYAAVENPVSVHDLHATMLHLLGIDHTRLTVKFQGLDARLTGISGEVIKAILT